MRDAKAYKQLDKYLKANPNPFWTLRWDYSIQRCTRVFTTLGAVVGLGVAVGFAAALVLLVRAL